MNTFENFDRFDPNSWSPLLGISGTAKKKRKSKPARFDFAAFFARVSAGMAITTVAVSSHAVRSSDELIQAGKNTGANAGSFQRRVSQIISPGSFACRTEAVGVAEVELASDNVSHHANQAGVVAPPSTLDVDKVLSAATREVLAAHGVERVRHFASLTAGWDLGRGGPLSKGSLHSFERFFGRGDLIPARMSVFLSTSGNLIANWLDSDGRVTEIEFNAEKEITYYIEAAGVESSIPVARMGELRRQLARASH